MKGKLKRDIIAREKVVGITFDIFVEGMNYLYSLIHRNSLIFSQNMHHFRFLKRVYICTFNVLASILASATTICVLKLKLQLKNVVHETACFKST